MSASGGELSALATVAPVFQNEWYGKWFATPDDFFKTVQCPDFACKAALYSVTIRFWFDTIPGGLTLSVFFTLICLFIYRIYKRGISLHYTTNAFLAFLLIVGKIEHTARWWDLAQPHPQKPAPDPEPAGQPWSPPR